MAADNEALAKKIRDHIRESDDPHALSVQEIAAALEVPVEDVVEVIDTFLVDASGGVSYVGDGAGGGWTPPMPEAA